MDPFGFEQLAAWTAHRTRLAPGPLFCVIDGATRGRRWSANAARSEVRQLALDAGVRRRFAPHQLRHAHAVELRAKASRSTSSSASSGIMRVIVSSAIGLVVSERGTEEAVGPLLGERPCLAEVDRDGRVADGERGEQLGDEPGLGVLEFEQA